MRSNETYSKVHKGKHLSDCFPIQKWSKTRRCFIATIFQLFFRICCSEGPGKLGGTEIESDTSVSCLC
jgi:hypothetical protein